MNLSARRLAVPAGALVALALAAFGVRMDAQGRGGQAPPAAVINESPDPLLQSFR